MKIGILTFHHAKNYGAVLQTFALQTTLKEMGANPYIIDRYAGGENNNSSNLPYIRSNINFTQILMECV